MTNKNSILIIDDEKPIRDILSASLKDEDYVVEVAADGKEGLEMLARMKPAVALLDIWMPGDLDGIDVLRIAKEKKMETEFVVMSGHGTIETAVKATKLGAWDFIEKPLSLDRIHILLNNIFAYQREKSQKAALLNKLRKNIAMIGDSALMRDTKERVANLPSKVKLVALHGQVGAGKELLAENIHYFSDRAGKAFVSMNAALSPDELVESEIFGFEKEAFTGAPQGKKGKLELADGGTLFVKEAHKLPKKVIDKLAIYLKTSKFDRQEGSEDLYSATRVVLATSKDQEELKSDPIFSLWTKIEDEFRFYLSPLRDRKEDIPALVDHFANISSKDNGLVKKAIEKSAKEELLNYPWPVNIRELKNFVERLYLLVNYEVVDSNGLHIAGLRIDASEELAELGSDSFKEARARFEKDFILQKLNEFDGNVSKTAEAIGLERSHLHRKIKGYGLDM